MEYGFSDWFACPECNASDEVSTLAYKREIVFECHGCGLTSEYVIGEDIGIKGLDLEAIADVADEQICD